MRVTNSSTRGSVLFSTLANTENLKSLDGPLDLKENSAVEQDYKNKYREKLIEAAKQKGYISIDAMISDQKKKDLKASLNNSLPISSDKQNNKEKLAEREGKQRVREASNLPPHFKTLDEIVKLDLLWNESVEKIGEIWNTYHSTRKCLSACLDSTFFDKLLSKGKLFPMVRYSQQLF